MAKKENVSTEEGNLLIQARLFSCLYITDGMKNSSFFGIMCIQNGLINNRKTYRKNVASTYFAP